jgi:DNA/RNA endonuclease YhcR with UshA esterase domain
LNALTGRLVSLQGKIVPYQGRAEIILRDPQQIRLIP